MNPENKESTVSDWIAFILVTVLLVILIRADIYFRHSWRDKIIPFFFPPLLTFYILRLMQL